MKRNIKALAGRSFDLAIVGGGVHGAALALEASRAGYRTALVEQQDFAHLTSANSLKIIHGGIRYLQHADFKRMRESIVSRREMMAFAPHLIKPLACLMPVYGHGKKGREMMRVAFAVYDLVAMDRNRGLAKENRLPAGRMLDKDTVAAEVAGLHRKGLSGGAVWYDALAENTERLILEYIKEASNYGCVAANYTKATGVYEENGRVRGLELDTDQGPLRLFCTAVVNAAGPWYGGLLGDSDSGNQQWATAVNLVVRKKLFANYAVGLEGATEYQDKDALIKRGKRLFFFVPWRGRYTMIGTVYKPYSGAIADFAVKREMLQEIVEEINTIYPEARLGLDDVSYFHGGLLPMKEVDESLVDSVQLEKSSAIVDHGSSGGPAGLFSIKGVKYTTATDIAGKTVRLLAKTKTLPPIRKASYQAKRANPVDFGKTIKELGKNFQEVYAHLQRLYGTGWRTPFRYLVTSCNDLSEAALWISHDPPLLRAEVIYFIREEMAMTLEDVVMRRSHLGSAECPKKELLDSLAALMATELGWSQQEKTRQIESIFKLYAPLQPES